MLQPTPSNLLEHSGISRNEHIVVYHLYLSRYSLGVSPKLALNAYHLNAAAEALRTTEDNVLTVSER